MRPSVALLVASSGIIEATWLNWPGHQHEIGAAGANWVPRETGAFKLEDVNGWTPKPTTAPGAVSGTDAVLKRLRRKRDSSSGTDSSDPSDDASPSSSDRSWSSSNSWEDNATCGWIANASAVPLVCGSSSSCLTSGNFVTCASGTMDTFYTVCFDYEAYKNGACNTLDAQTGCCYSSNYPACGTFVWASSPMRTMYECFSSSSVITLLDEPAVLLSATTDIATTSAEPSSITLASATLTSATHTSATPTSTTHPSPGPGTKTGAIVGGTIGGIAGAALAAGAVAWFCIRRRAQQRANPTYNPVPMGDAPSGGMYYASTITTTPTSAPLPTMAFPPMSPCEASPGHVLEMDGGTAVAGHAVLPIEMEGDSKRVWDLKGRP